MLRGFFDRFGRPYVEASLVLPQLGLVVQGLRLLVDTGSDASAIGPRDAYDMGLDLRRLSRVEPLTGVGGLAERVTTHGDLIFHGEDSVYAYRLDLDIFVPRPEIMALPSILGRYALDRWRMVYDPSEHELSFTVRSADLTAPLP